MSKKQDGHPFPLPSEIEDVPGTVGWEDVYPYAPPALEEIAS